MYVDSRGKSVHLVRLLNPFANVAGMIHLLRSVSLFGVSPEAIADLRPDDRRTIAALMSEGLKSTASSTVKPLDRVQLPPAITSIPW